MSSGLKKRSLDGGGTGDDEAGKKCRLLSCQRCRIRKIKCNYEYPCSNCIKNGTDCVKTVDDKRKKRPPANYVSNLENQVKTLVQMIEKIKNVNSTEARNKLIDSIDLGGETLGFGERHKMWDILNPVEQESHLPVDHKRSVYAPTSVYHNDLISKDLSLLHKREETSISTLNKDPVILQCIKLFFTWQYPDNNMFIFREAFLIDFFNPRPDSLYCSRILVLSICALGSRMAEDEITYMRSIQFYKEAKSLLFAELDHPSITSLQSFLLLAFYDICNGLNSSGWMLSGNAIRMGYDLGFQLDPKVWFLKSQNDLSPLDVAIRSRIYWGSYMADHFISLLLGRPSLLKMSDATIAESDDLPELEWIDEYRYIDPKDKTKSKKENFRMSYPLKSIINLINISDNMLNDIFTRSEEDHDEGINEDLNLALRLEKLSEYNIQIGKWKDSLPEDIAWNSDCLSTEADNPLLMSVRYYYYILILCLNRPFIEISKSIAGKNHMSPADICTEAIEDLYLAIQRFKKVHGLRRASIYIVYCSILSLSVILLTSHSSNLAEETQDKISFFMDVLKGCSKTWKLAEKSYTLIKLKLKSNLDIERDSFKGAKTKDESSNSDKVHSINNQTSMKGFKTLSKAYTHFQMGHHSDSKIGKVSNLYKSEANGSIASENSAVASGTQPELSHNAIVGKSFSHILFGDNDSSKFESTPYNNPALSDEPLSVKSVWEDESLEFFGGPPVLMTSDLFNEDWESLFPDYIFNAKH